MFAQKNPHEHIATSSELHILGTWGIQNLLLEVPITKDNGYYKSLLNFDHPCADFRIYLTVESQYT